MEVPWALDGLVGALAGPTMHCHCIVGSWFARKVSCLSTTCEDVVCMVVARSVDGSQVDDNGPMDPRQVNHGHCWYILTHTGKSTRAWIPL